MRFYKVLFNIAIVNATAITMFMVFLHDNNSNEYGVNHDCIAGVPESNFPEERILAGYNPGVARIIRGSESEADAIAKLESVGTSEYIDLVKNHWSEWERVLKVLDIVQDSGKDASVSDVCKKLKANNLGNFTASVVYHLQDWQDVAFYSTGLNIL